MTGITPGSIEIDRFFAASPAEVFEAWTTPEHFSRWFGGSSVEVPLDQLDFAPEIEGSWTATMVLPDGNAIHWAGDFLEIVPNERFVFTLTDNPESPERAAVVVTLTEATEDGVEGTRLHFTQETPGFAPEQQEAALAGWQAFLDELIVADQI
ncbi:SRPBCC domain-containing protein [Mycetocola tolaasinivorans]|uniref:SRPBCC domain-containing protein n=1 Tax=Mycetocola tolaasinivorans TaxID=76635 RepID=A0A3L7A696_9MICO|nr:SRPBCC domain-containing protein [Mycetocola tolaasinivorans]RLP75644.1 SRPBCC domain-containing protein [Mycetocola tolaasinivorans]